MDVLNRRGTRIALAIAPVIAIAVVLGVLFGRKGGSNAGGETPPPPEDVLVRSSITTSPSGMPSVAITEPPRVVQCPIGEKEFILKYSNRENDDGQRRRHRRLDTPPQQQQQQQRSLTEFSTWYVKDACTGEKIVSCIPCPSLISQASASLSPVASSLAPTPGIYKVSQSSSSSSPPTAGSTSSSPVATTAVVHHDTSSYHIKNNDRRYLQNNEQLIIVPNTQQILQEASRECIPSDLSYVFVVESTESPDECCSFDAAEYVVTFDDEVIAFVGANGSSSGSNSIEQMILFGQTGVTCASGSPSDIPSEVPSVLPSVEPSMEPSDTISNDPSVVSSEVPSNLPTTSPSKSPSIPPTIPPPPTMNPTFIPTTKRPTTVSPTKRQKEEVETEAPTVIQQKQPVPSLRPTCKNDQNFNLCIAVDMSGSICSNESGCIGCPSDTCRDEFVTQGTCCNNFAFVKGFASLMIQSLSNFPAEKTFSIVQFATEGQLISLMETNDEALSTIDQLYYTGGITNHAEAISECRRSLSASLAFQQSAIATSDTTFVPPKNIMVLITDGKPTTPDDDPLGAAMKQARKAREENEVFIIPVFISPRYDSDALSFMRGLSSNDKVFDVVDFESLKTLKDRLLEEVSCSL
ncbi:vWA domain-containing protein [Skeletonema marinoi]|uniref:VWA domain-containing protein n=1 Tax=Skeletonema marinoi TaxID=267567 RepID=A0AAD8XXG5_9STRA|nr:vWA domain-containing protein [Skeletonema marinoi]